MADDHAKPLDDSISPGKTKFGVNEYYVEKAYMNEGFYIENTCGDPAYSETVYFEGKIGR